MNPDTPLTTGYLSKRPENAARVLEKFPCSMTADLFTRLAVDKYLPTFQRFIPSYAAALLDILPTAPQKSVINELSSAQLSVLLTFFDDSKRKKILAHLSSARHRKVLSRMLQYPEGSVGSLMTPPVLTLPQDITGPEALKRVKQSKDFHYSEVIVLDKNLGYLGLVSLHKLIQAPPHLKLGALVDHKLPSLSARKSLDNVSDNQAWKFVRVLPVTDGQGLVVGILNYATLVQYNALPLPEAAPRRTRQSSPLELLFLAPVTLIEAVVDKLFPLDQNRTTRD